MRQQLGAAPTRVVASRWEGEVERATSLLDPIEDAGAVEVVENVDGRWKVTGTLSGSVY